MLTFIMLNDSSLDLVQGFMKLIVLLLVVLRIFACGLIVPLLLLFDKLNQSFSLVLRWVSDKLLIFKFVLCFVNQGFKLIFWFGKASLFFFSFFVIFQHILCSFIKLFLYIFDIEWLFGFEGFFVFLCNCFVLLYSLIFNLFLFLFVLLFRLFAGSFVLLIVTLLILYCIFRLLNVLFFLLCRFLFFLIFNLSLILSLVSGLIFNLRFSNLLQVSLNLILLVGELTVS